MRIKRWVKVTTVQSGDIYVDNEFYKSERDDEKEIHCVIVQDGGVVSIYTKEGWNR